MFGNLGAGEIIFILLIVLLVFGAKRLPEIGQSLGKGIREFKKSMSDISGELNQQPPPQQYMPPQQPQYMQPQQPPQYAPPPQQQQYMQPVAQQPAQVPPAAAPAQPPATPPAGEPPQV